MEVVMTQNIEVETRNARVSKPTVRSTMSPASTKRDEKIAAPSSGRVEGMLYAFDHLGYGALLVDRDGQVLGLNSQAKDHLGLSIQVVHGQLTAGDRAATERLQQLIASVAAHDEAGPANPPAVVLSRPRGRPVVAYISPVPKNLRGAPGAGEGIVLLVDPQTERETPDALLQQAFGLTPAETRLALGLVNGHGLQSLAQLHNLSVGTLRVRLKSIFAKTNTKRQSELLMLIAKLSLFPR